MRNPSFNGMSAAVISGLILSAALIITMCVVPKRLICSLYSENKESVRTAIELAESGENEIALQLIKKVMDNIENRKNTLLLFFDHNDVVALSGAAGTAYELAQTDDPAQLIAELREIEKSFEYLIHTNDFSIYNIL